MADTTISGSIKEITNSFTDLLDQTLNASLDMLQTFTKAGTDFSSNLSSRFAPQMKALNLPSLGGCCKIPPPCWMPRELTAVTSHVCAGATASLRFRVTNCGIDARTITVEADQNASVNPPSLQLGAFQRGWVTVSYTVPPTSTGAQSSADILIFVHGCKSYYLRWTVQNSTRGCDCCHEIEIDDCPDLVHHWYDHFYCPRPCRPVRQVQGR
jgi:hypothetical protein